MDSQLNYVHLIANFATEVSPSQWYRLFEPDEKLSFRHTDGTYVVENPALCLFSLYKQQIAEKFKRHKMNSPEDATTID